MNAALSVHDRYQFELKTWFASGRGRQKRQYDLEFFLFSPVTLGVEPDTFEPDRFFEYVQNYIRLKTPSCTLADLSKANSMPFVRLGRAIENLLRNPKEKNERILEREIKLFGSIVKSALRDHYTFLTRAKQADVPILVEQYASFFGEIAAQYRGMRPQLLVPPVSDRIRHVFDYGDEFLSLTGALFAYRVLQHLTRCGIDPGEGREKLSALITGEIRYRKERHFPSVPSEDGDNETFIYRRGVLKKFIGSVLFLDNRKTREGTMTRHVLHALAAGMAMLFATLVAFYAQRHYGRFTLPVLVALVVSYMFKDRIKELGRAFFNRILSRYRFKRRIQIRHGGGRKFGVCRDVFRYASEKELPSDVAALRSKDHLTDIENEYRGETVVHYRKRLEIAPARSGGDGWELPLEGIADIMRFNVEPFMRKMDDPQKRVYFLAPDGTVKIRKGERVYHLNLVLRVSGPDGTRLGRYRIVLNREGIRRIESLKEIGDR